MLCDECPDAAYQVRAMKTQLLNVNLAAPEEKIINDIDYLEYHYRNRHVTTVIYLYKGDEQIHKWDIKHH